MIDLHNDEALDVAERVLFYDPADLSMVSTRSVVSLLRPEAKVNHFAMDDSSDVIAWVEGSKTVRLGRLVETGTLEVFESFNTQHRVSYLGFHRDGLLVGDDLESLMFYHLDGTLAETQTIDGGVQSCRFMGLRVVILSGMGEVVLVQRERDSVNLSTRLGLDDVVHVEVHGERVYVAEQRGTVLTCTEDSVVWRRPPRGEHGERITALGLTKEGSLFLTREGHALVSGEEEAIEFEVWQNDQLLARNDLRTRLLTSSTASWGPCLDSMMERFIGCMRTVEWNASSRRGMASSRVWSTGRASSPVPGFTSMARRMSSHGKWSIKGCLDCWS